MQAINGGSDNSSTTNVGINIGTDSLLSMDYSWTQGDRHYEMHLSAGNDVYTNFNAFGNQTS